MNQIQSSAWIRRDFKLDNTSGALPIKVLKGPRQVGKTSLLQQLEGYQLIYLDDAATRLRAQADPRLFFDQCSSRIIIDEAALAPQLFPELKRRVDEMRRTRDERDFDVWITGSNQTLIQRTVQESLAGRASYFDLNTLSVHELAERYHLSTYLLRGGWPELYVSSSLDPVRYLNDLISTFIEHDIVVAAGIERRAAFIKALSLTAGRIGQLINYSDIAVSAGVESTTVQSWLSILELNGILRRVMPYYTNLNKRLIKAPKYYFEDVGLASRLQGWTTAEPLLNSPQFGNSFENCVLAEISRFFVNRGMPPTIHYVRSKEKVEVDFLIDLGNQKFLAVEVKTTAQDFTESQNKLLESLGINIVERWVVSASEASHFRTTKVFPIWDLWIALNGLCGTSTSPNPLKP